MASVAPGDGRRPLGPRDWRHSGAPHLFSARSPARSPARSLPTVPAEASSPPTSASTAGSSSSRDIAPERSPSTPSLGVIGLAPPDISTLVTFDDKKPLASGGFCDIYRGVHQTEGVVALKFPRLRNSEEVVKRRFWREITVWFNSRHENILPLLGVVHRDDNFYMVAKWAEKGNLLEHVNAEPHVDRVKLLIGVARGMTYLHGSNPPVVHGDLKAANVLVDHEGNPQLIDFGLSKTLDSVQTSTELKGCGSIPWSAPELMDGESKTLASDVYAYAILIFEVLSGITPFASLPSPAAVIRAVALNAARPPKDPSHSADGLSYYPLWALAEKGWDTDIQARPSMPQVLERLVNISIRGLPRGISSTDIPTVPSAVPQELTLPQLNFPPFTVRPNRSQTFSQESTSSTPGGSSLRTSSSVSPGVIKMQSYGLLPPDRSNVPKDGLHNRSEVLPGSSTRVPAPRIPINGYDDDESDSSSIISIMTSSSYESPVMVDSLPTSPLPDLPSTSLSSRPDVLPSVPPSFITARPMLPPDAYTGPSKPYVSSTLGASPRFNLRADLPDETEGPVECSGFMKKSNRSLFAERWSYFELIGHTLYYYKDSAKTQKEGQIHLLGYRIVPGERTRGGSSQFNLVHQTEPPHTFKVPDENTAAMWMAALVKGTIAVDYSKPVKSTFNGPTLPLPEARALFRRRASPTPSNTWPQLR